MIQCGKCSKQSEYSQINKSSNGAKIYLLDNITIQIGKICTGCRNKKAKIWKIKTNSNIKAVQYNKTKTGYLVRTYRNMLSRVSGVLKKKAHLYKGKEILSKQDFYDWSLQNKSFHLLFENYLCNNYNMKLSPSIDRIDSSKGYIIDNMRWITHSENSSLGSKSRNAPVPSAIRI